jgi:hypothetical protein
MAIFKIKARNLCRGFPLTDLVGVNGWKQEILSVEK